MKSRAWLAGWLVVVVAATLASGVLFAAAQQPQKTQQPPDLNGCWTLTASSYYNPEDTVNVAPYNYMQRLLDSTPNQQGTPIPKGNPLESAVIKFKQVMKSPGDLFYLGDYVAGPTTTHWLAHVVTGGTPEEPVYYIPMSATGPTTRNFSTMAIAYISAYAGIADNDTRITGTWVDSRGAMNLKDLQCADQPAPCPNAATPHDVSLHTIIFPVNTGRYTLDRVQGRCPQ